MNKTFLIVLVLSAIFAATLETGVAQDPPSPIFQVVNALKQQQTQLAENQNSIDEKLAGLEDTIRAARIFMSRAGGKHKAPPSK
jgi:peptidoglycan hydrolase CwlO-like protein